MDGHSRDEIAELLVRGPRGAPRPSLANVALILGGDAEWRGEIARDELAGVATLRGRPITDDDVLYICVTLEERYSLVLRPPIVRDAVKFLASQRVVHPIDAYLRGQDWDGVDHIAELAQVGFGLDAGGARVLQRWMIGSVAAMDRPAVERGRVLTIAPEGGIESMRMAFRLLYRDPGWYRAVSTGRHDTQGAWVVEVRLTHLRHVALLQELRDRHDEVVDRLPGGATVRRPVRWTLLALVEPQLARRLGSACVVVRSGGTDTATVLRTRDAAWRQAWALYQAGEPYALARRQDLTSEAAAIERYLDAMPVRAWDVDTLLFSALDIETHELSHERRTLAGAVLKLRGYGKGRPRTTPTRQRVWSPPAKAESDP